MSGGLKREKRDVALMTEKVEIVWAKDQRLVKTMTLGWSKRRRSILWKNDKDDIIVRLFSAMATDKQWQPQGRMGVRTITCPQNHCTTVHVMILRELSVVLGLMALCCFYYTCVIMNTVICFYCSFF